MRIIQRAKLLLNQRNFSDYFFTFGVEFSILVISVLLFKIINIRYGSIGFAEFTIGKRLVGFVMPLLMMGLGVSLPKFLPLETKEKQLSIHYTAILMVSSLFTAISIAFLVFPEYFSKFVFGNTSHKKLLLANLFYVYALMLHACVYNYFRGKLNFKMSSLLQFVNLGLIPLLSCFLVGDILTYMMMICALTLMFLLIISSFFIRYVKLTPFEIKDSFKLLANYGVQRMPGDVVLGLFFALPAFVASNYFSITDAGLVAFCMSLFNIIIAFMSPINIILLPKASKIVFDKDYNQLKSISKKLLSLSIFIGIISIVTVQLFGNKLLELFSVSDVPRASIFLKIVFSGVIGFSIFSVIRSIIDAFYAKAKNTINILFSFLVFVFLIFTVNFFNKLDIKIMLISFSVCINFLGLLTYYSLSKINTQV